MVSRTISLRDPRKSEGSEEVDSESQMPQFPANFDLSTLDGSTGFVLSNGPSDLVGWSVSSAGDVNGDGFSDVIVGAPFDDEDGAFSGTSYVVFGKASGFAAKVDLSSLDGTTGFKVSGAVASDFSGGSVASAGDINGDGFADVIIAVNGNSGVNASGASYVVFGRASGFAPNIDFSTLNGTTGFKLSGVATSDLIGRSVASAGDVNGDGFADLILGSQGAGWQSEGASYVVFGKASGFGANVNLST